MLKRKEQFKNILLRLQGRLESHLLLQSPSHLDERFQLITFTVEIERKVQNILRSLNRVDALIFINNFKVCERDEFLILHNQKERKS
jgi:hypothetical protein